jgi:hypothetical protein
MRFSTAIPLILATLANAAALPKPVTDVAVRQEGGFKNVAYFVNWVSIEKLLYKTHVNIQTRPSTGGTSIPKTLWGRN